MTSRFICIFLFSCSQAFAQTDHLEFEFQQTNDTLGIFQVWNSSDTSTIVATVRFNEDTIRIKELTDTVLVKRSVHGVNTSAGTEKSSLPEYVKQNYIATKFYYLGDNQKVIHIPSYDVHIDNSTMLKYQSDQKKDNDTMHYLKFNPHKFDSIQFKSSTFCSEYMRPYLKSSGGKRKGFSHSEEAILDFWLFQLDIYYSNYAFNFSLPNLIGNTLFIGKRHFVVVYESL